jgi:gamma-glutamyltranspeptidase / glutathione hydrolase
MIRKSKLFVMLSTALLVSCGTSSVPFTAAPEGTFLPPEPPSGFTAKTIAYTNKDMVAAANPLAVDAGVKILAEGGSAVDAAIAVQMVLNLVEPQSSGIGGGAFMLHHDASKKETIAYDGRETAPAAATADMFKKNGVNLLFTPAVDGGLSVGTPGLLKMLEMAHQKHGKLPWAKLFDEAIRISYFESDECFNCRLCSPNQDSR